MSGPIIEMKAIHKEFPGVVANDHVDLSIYPGEVHALLGENGAGKSTLMSVLNGIYKPDGGDILFRGEPVVLKTPKDAVNLGLGMVHQHFELVDTMTVSENVFLGSPECGGILKPEDMNQKVLECSQKYRLDVDPSALVWQLSIGEQQRVEIIKLLFRGAEILILDEPSAVLTPQESDAMFLTLRNMAGDGKAVVFITHKMREVLTYADRITVLRNGRSVASMLRGQTDQNQLTSLMVGRELTCIPDRSPAQCGEEILSLENVDALNDKGLPALREVTFGICSGEILGIAGVAGNGQRELAEVVAGLRKVTAGSITLAGKTISNRGPAYVMKQGGAFIPEDRLGMGLVPNLDMVSNSILKTYNDRKHSRHGFLKMTESRAEAEALVEEYNIKSAGIRKPIKLMSGGNQQKLLVGREIKGEPSLIVAAYPVRGLDVGATREIHNILQQQRERGAAILLISEDLDELFELADRIAVFFEGRLMGIVDRHTTTYNEIGCMMVGAEMKPESEVS